ncbi:DNA-directed RNA polymerase III subunit 1 isoform X1 [Ziziphus jujuba]|uniref:DNA-directed RNA polymerase subunit n=1 Tax=Ziziphus jujuba TaxID=326968 RepID=A0A6P3ZKU7_ZIZJJ|nr:DNA-directed RNA polymerase III subunit 1 isoform X1 [Ziziphus jujuba]
MAAVANRDQTQSIVFTKQLFIEDVGPRRLKSMQFTTLSGSEISKLAEVQVWKGQYYDSNRKPIENGLLDPRMGPPNKNSKCATCHGSYAECPGHYGYLKLALPVYNVGYISSIVDILKCICKNCSRILLEDERRQKLLKKMRSPKMDALKKTRLMKDIVKDLSNKAIKCYRCGYVNGKVKKSTASQGVKIFHDRSRLFDGLEDYKSAISHIKDSKISLDMSNHVINPAMVHFLFKRMLDEDCELLYLSDRPEKLMMVNIAVPPIPIRPSVIADGDRSNENDITERLKRVVQVNASLQQELLEANCAARLSGWDDLQVEVAQYINSDVRGGPFAMQVAKPMGGFVQRLKGKQGRFRGNLSGKRVEYTGRTVISPDPNLKITEVAIPIHMARILTYPERVSYHNIEKLRQCVSNGPDKYPGARMLRRADGSQWNLNVARKRRADELKYGDIVDRHLEDGDIVLFNRQPSLHRMSIMCHRARVMPWRTLRFNESVCNPYNADFDGDEMNMHVPQTEEARTEAILLMGVQNNLCTPKNGEILVASTQDFLTSSFLITRKDTFYDRAAFSLMCSYMGDGMDHIDLPTPAVIKPVELWTGKQLFSILVRPDANVRVFLNLTVREKNYTKLLVNGREIEALCPNDGFVYFRNSELISGQLGKATLGNGNKDGLYFVLLRDYKTHAAAACMNRLAKLSARWIGNHGFSIGIDDVQPSKRLHDQKQELILEGYGKCDEKINLYNEGSLPPEPGCNAAQTLEAKISQILNGIRDATGKLCMQELHWRNSPLIMSQCGSKGSPINISQMIACVGQQSVGGRRAPDGFIDRSLPHFHRNQKTPGAKGFVANSFYSGLSATEFFFHTMGGREGLVDTAVKTADTGYMSRRLMKAMEDLCVHYDDAVRNASGCIVQFRYGDDNMDPANMEGKNGAPLNFERLFLKAKATCPAGENEKLSPEKVSEIVESRISQQDMTPEWGCSLAFKTSLKCFLDEYVMALKRTQERFGLIESLAAMENFETVEKIVLHISGVTARQLEVFLDTCISRYHMKKIEPGTAIGAIGGHSIGEPGTQMTLKTFHFAGVASMNITQGVPRIKEIINAAKKISTPVITATLECDDNVNVARVVRGRIEKTRLCDVAKTLKTVMTNRSAAIVITLDMDMIQDAQLSIDANVVQESILKTPKIKLKQEHIKVLEVKKLEILPQEVDRSKIHFNLNYLKSILPTVIVKGIKTIERVIIKKEEDKKTQMSKCKLLVEGTGLLDVMGTEGVDGRNTTSNHIIEVYQTLGIEAARKCIINEIEETMKSHGMSIDNRHMMLLADVMTFRGEVLGINRFGIQNMDKSILMLASFEKTADHLFNASVNGRVDNIEGVSESIIMGMPVQIGTGLFKVKQRVDVPSDLCYGPDPILRS